MDGEIRIVDKNPGERGTCFSFNVILLACKPESAGTEGESSRMHYDRYQNGFQSFSRNLRGSGPKSDGSHVVLHIEGEERRKVLANYIESWNIKVSNVKHYKNLVTQLDKIKRKLDVSYFNYSENPQLDCLSQSASSKSDSRTNDGSFHINNDGNDQSFPPLRKTTSKSSSGIVLVVVDTNAGTFSELHPTLANFRKDLLSSRCKVVWLHNPIMCNAYAIEMEELAPLNDYVIYKPFHGSRLYEVLGLIPELKGWKLPKLETRSFAQMVHSQYPKSSNDQLDYAGDEPAGSSSSSNDNSVLEEIVVVHDKHSKECNGEKLLNGKRVLVVDDAEPLRKLTATLLKKHGALVEVCTNGKEAYDCVCKALSNQVKEREPKCPPYGYIFMDCQVLQISFFSNIILVHIVQESGDKFWFCVVFSLLLCLCRCQQWMDMRQLD